MPLGRYLICWVFVRWEGQADHPDRKWPGEGAELPETAGQRLVGGWGTGEGTVLFKDY